MQESSKSRHSWGGWLELKSPLLAKETRYNPSSPHKNEVWGDLGLICRLPWAELSSQTTKVAGKESAIHRRSLCNMKTLQPVLTHTNQLDYLHCQVVKKIFLSQKAVKLANKAVWLFFSPLTRLSVLVGLVCVCMCRNSHVSLAKCFFFPET